MTPAPTENAHWRDSARVAKFFFIDAKAAFPIFLFLIHIRFWTFILALIIMIFFTVLNRFGYSVEVFLRIFRSIFAGPRKLAIPWWTN
ncbi:MAG: IcmT/TraK family protein [Coxiellaceae bacterium]|jgi:intracellular multiplication protein IcmT|nr:IcmT/TraK family protein [Coxiellaceae bacterium]